MSYKSTWVSKETVVSQHASVAAAAEGLEAFVLFLPEASTNVHPRENISGSSGPWSPCAFAAGRTCRFISSSSAMSALVPMRGKKNDSLEIKIPENQSQCHYVTAMSPGTSCFPSLVLLPHMVRRDLSHLHHPCQFHQWMPFWRLLATLALEGALLPSAGKYSLFAQQD